MESWYEIFIEAYQFQLINGPGLYTSPHLVAVRERIRINGAPISEEQFTKFFFEVWDKLTETEVGLIKSLVEMGV